ncbi:hypothetical protein GIB67_041600 [Kingdonia uniflora]|uniref:Retrotransposon gag domain-containing protein n=1 Tax=Kingdonia uniflora TaxID=39325 RepID=A0A7J7MQC8_9MAGN|nr:hypothetical protein GIB67_041600 [Kingdonia uniflora]
MGKTLALRNTIVEFAQNRSEMFYEACERYKDLLSQCPHHGFGKQHLVKIFYRGMTSENRYRLESMHSGKFQDLEPDRAYEELETLAENSHQWDSDPYRNVCIDKKDGLHEGTSCKPGSQSYSAQPCHQNEGAITGFSQPLMYWFYEYCGVGHPIAKEEVKFSAYPCLRAWERENRKKTNDQASNLFMLGRCHIDHCTIVTITWEPWLEFAVSKIEDVLNAKLLSCKRMPL